MSELTKILGDDGPRYEFPYKGEVYRVSLVTQQVKVAYEKRLFARAKAVAREMRDLLTPREYRKHLKQLNDDYIAGEYAFMSLRGMKAMKSVESMTYLVSLLFGISEEKALGLTADATEEVEALLDVVLRESFPVDPVKLEKRKKAAEAKKKQKKALRDQPPAASAEPAPTENMRLVSATRSPSCSTTTTSASPSTPA